MEKLDQEERNRLQRIMSELSEYQSTAEVLRRHLSLLTTSLSELSTSMEAIRTLKTLEPGSEILAPLGSDSFLIATLGAVDRVLTGLGANAAAERSTEDAIKVLEDRRVELERALAQAREQLGKLVERIEILRPEAERILKKIRKESP